MPTLVVSFTHIDVHDDADNWDGGEIYYDFQISDKSVISRSRDTPHDVDSGGVIQVNHQRTLKRPDNDPNAFLKISGWVSEADDTFNGGDDNAGSFVHIHNQANGWGVGTNSVRLSGDGLDVTVHYDISVAQVDDNL